VSDATRAARRCSIHWLCFIWESPLGAQPNCDPCVGMLQWKFRFVMRTVLPAPALTPETGHLEGEQHSPLYHVVLLDDDEHTYDYVIEMLVKLFVFPQQLAFEHAMEVDTTGRTTVITCELPQAEFARDQIQAYGADPRMPKSKGSMSAVLIPAEGVKTK
jgi:ATP-dependent Clp protease adaptor protein ClpS